LNAKSDPDNAPIGAPPGFDGRRAGVSSELDLSYLWGVGWPAGSTESEPGKIPPETGSQARAMSDLYVTLR